MKPAYKTIIGLVALLSFADSAQAGWKTLRDGTGNITGIFTFAQNSYTLAMYYNCSAEETPACSMYLQLASSCDVMDGSFNLPIQYGNKTTTATLECIGFRGNSFGAAGGINTVGQPGERTHHTYSWKITLPGQGPGPVPEFSDKKLTFMFPGDGKQYKYTFTTRGAAKAMERHYQYWANHSE